MITEEMIPQIEKAFGFQLYDWQKDYILGKINYRAGGRHNGNTFAFCLKLLLSDGEPIKLSELHTYTDELHGSSYPWWFGNYCYEINDTLVRAGFKTRLDIERKPHNLQCKYKHGIETTNGKYRLYKEKEYGIITQS